MHQDFLHPLRKGNHVKSDNSHTIINIDPLAHTLDNCALILSSCAIFTVYPNHLTKRHSPPSPGDNHQSVGGRSVRTKGKANWPCETHPVTLYTRALHSFVSFAYCRPASSVAQGHLDTIHPAQPQSTSYSSSTHPSGHTILIRSFHMTKSS